VAPIYEGPDHPACWEADLLGGRLRSVYAREVVLYADSVPALLARTLVRHRDPAVDTLRRLQRTPLAEVLFQDARWVRAGEPTPLLLNTGRDRIPGRACVWHNTRSANSVILVEEFFLPALAESRR
jgi:chorismate-pyruvate lyase